MSKKQVGSRVQVEKLGLERRTAEHPGPDAGR